jgi:hypothetical protein
MGGNGQETALIRGALVYCSVGSERRFTFPGSNVFFRRKVELCEGQNQKI